MDFFSVYKASRQCRRRKRATPQAQFYEAYLLDNLVETVQALRSGRWRPRRPVCFIVDKPKAREIHAAHYSDRVVHHWLVPQLEKLYEPVFIHDVYSNRIGKGTHRAVKRLQSFMRGVVRTSREPQKVRDSSVGSQPPARKDDRMCLSCPIRPEDRAPTPLVTALPFRRIAIPCAKRDFHKGYFLQLDIKNFFNSIDRAILFAFLQKRLRNSVKHGKITDSAAVACREIVGKEAYMAATREEINRVPAYKRLANSGPDKGLPIGNLTSQFFANVYLNELDQFVKHQLKCRYYLRYMDDFILLHNDPAQLESWRTAIIHFLAERLHLELKQIERPRPVSDGANFFGYIVRPEYLLIRRQVIGNLRDKLILFEKKWIRGNEQHGWLLTLPPEPRDHLRSVLASYWGHFRHGCHYHLMQKILFRFPWLHCLFMFIEDRIIPCWQPHYVGRYKGQQRFFQRMYPHAIIEIQCGCAYDKIDNARIWSNPVPRANKAQNRAGDCAPTHAGACESTRRSPVPRAKINPRLFVGKVIVRQQGYLKGGLRRRCVESITIPPYSQTGVRLCGNTV